jgi:TetR/AcrR family transcriptional regulator
LRAQRTTELILSTAKRLFLERGFGGTRIEHITEESGISRASFYTYFPTKRDVLLALGAGTFSAVGRCIALLEAVEEPTFEAFEAWARSYFDLLDEDGAFVLAWGQASAEDDELRTVGRRAIVYEGRRVGAVLRRMGGRPDEDGLALGLAVFALLDRYWSIIELMKTPVSRDEASRTIAAAMLGLVSAG